MKKQNIFFIELIIWLIILSCIFYGFFYKKITEENLKNTYYIVFEDAGGLVKGSGVRLMGINIGYVKDIKILDGKVLVSILVTKKNTDLPQNAHATIEFYGLGGSTSLELHPSSASIPNRNIMPLKAYRVQDYWDGQKLTADTMIETYDSVRKSIDDADLLNNKQVLFQSKMVKELIKVTQKIADEQNVIIKKLEKEEK